MNKLTKLAHKRKLVTKLWLTSDDDNVVRHYLTLALKYRDLITVLERSSNVEN